MVGPKTRRTHAKSAIRNAKPAVEFHRMNVKAVTQLCLEQSMVLTAHVWMVTR